MTKVSDDIKDLQRSLSHLQLLGGRPLWTTEGLLMTWPGHVTDPRPLLTSCREHGGATLAALQLGVTMTRAPVRLTAEWLGRARRDLRRLRAVEQFWHDNRTLDKFPRPDQAWLEGREVLLQKLQDLHHQPSPAPQDWFEAARNLVGWLRGEVARKHVQSLVWRPANQNWRRARKRIEMLADCLRKDLAPADDPALQAAWQRLRRLRAQPAPRRVLQILSRLVGQTSDRPPINCPTPARWDLPEYARRLGLALLEDARIAPQPSSDLRQEQAVGWALLFDPDPDIDLAGLSFTQALTLTGRGLSLAQAVPLLRLKVEPKTLEGLVKHVAAGLSLAALLPLEPLKLGDDTALSRLANMPVNLSRTRAWCAWIARLVPHFQAMHVALDVPDHLFGRYSEEVPLLAHCLFSLPASQQLGWLKSTLAIFGNAPEQIPSLLDGLEGTAEGLGARLYPGFCAWLGDPTLLDRHFYLLQKAGLEPALRPGLLRDFDRPLRLAAERDWLITLQKPTRLQSLRLVKLCQPETPVCTASVNSYSDWPCKNGWMQWCGRWSLS